MSAAVHKPRPPASAAASIALPPEALRATELPAPQTRAGAHPDLALPGLDKAPPLGLCNGLLKAALRGLRRHREDLTQRPHNPQRPLRRAALGAARRARSSASRHRGPLRGARLNA